MGYEYGSTSNDDQEEDEEDECEEVGGSNRLLGFMFGNVDGSGDLDVDYLDEDAKEHLAALADKLGPSLTDIDLSEKSPLAHVDAAEQDYEEKAEDAVDYEDIDEQYEGPEVQAVTEEDALLSGKTYFSIEISLASIKNETSLFGDDNYDDYDEDEEESKKDLGDVDNSTEARFAASSGAADENATELPLVEKLTEDDLSPAALKSEQFASDLAVSQEEELHVFEEPGDDSSGNSLPVLCIEGGDVILRFSEIFGIHEPLKKAERKDHRYSVSKDKHTTVDASEFVEEDEERFLRGHFQNLICMKQARIIPEDTLILMDNGLESTRERGDQKTGTTASEADLQGRECCRTDLPMKEELSLDLLERYSPLSPNFYALDQLDWEDKILWDNSPELKGNTTDNSDISGPGFETSAYEETALEDVAQVVSPKFQMEMNEYDSSSLPYSHSISLESFGSRNFSGETLPVLERAFHPQLLRLESQLEENSSNYSGSRSGDESEQMLHSDAIRRFSRITLQNRDITEGSWVDKIMWDPQLSTMKPKLIFDLQDEQMLFEILDGKDDDHLWLHAGAMIITRPLKSGAGDSSELLPPGARFNISNDKFYSNRKSAQQLKSYSKKRTARVKVLHSIPALRLQTMKPKLSNKDIANFHRPRALWYPHDLEVAIKEQGKLPTQRPMKVILKSLGGKGSKLHVDGEETIFSLKAKASKKLDFKPSEPVKIYYSGKELEDDKTLAAQNVQPNSLLHLVRTKIYLLPKAQKLPGENKSLRPPGAFKKKSDLSAKDGHVFLMEYCEERPLLLGNVGMGARLCTYHQKSPLGDQTGASVCNGSNSLGNTIILDHSDKSPFLGDIKSGCNQSSLETNMYRAPIFPHKVSSTDFLLIRSAKGKLSIRRIDRINVVGQQEPHMEVMTPGSKGVQTYIMNRLLTYMYREFHATEKGGLHPCIRADELFAQFPNMTEAFLRKRLKHCTDLQKRSNGQLFWVMRRNFRIPLEEEMRRMVTPENVCAYESMLAGLHRLKRLGITRLIQPTGISTAMNQLPDEAIALAAASHIERELQITPWNLSSNFVACTNQDRENIERLEITGVGDPSGRGLGFSFVRTSLKAPVSNAMVKKKAAIARGGSTLTGTDADLRRLSMDAAREVLLKFNVPEEQIAKLTRWHRIAMIRKLSSEQAASGVKVDATTISKFARGQRMSFLQLQQQTREKCQEIWDRQVQSLSAFDEENESDSEANSDLDSFAGDLENLLDAEEFEEGDDGDYESRHENSTDGVKGIKMRRRHSEAQVEEEMEDEEAEAAELCRMLMDDDEAEKKKKKKVKGVANQPGLIAGSNVTYALENTEKFRKYSMTVKQITSVAQNDGSYASKENINKDLKEDECFSAKRNIPAKLKAKKKDDVANMSMFKTKVKILGDVISTIKEKKSARESFVCGACGQPGHMKTNKNCPKFGENVEIRHKKTDIEKAAGKQSFLDLVDQLQQKPSTQKPTQKSLNKITPFETSEDEKSSSKAKVLKVKCGSNDTPPDKLVGTAAQISETPFTSDAETVNRSAVKVNKIIFSSKMKPEEVQVESRKPSIVIRPPMEADGDQPRKKIIIKQPKEIINLEEVSQEESTSHEYKKGKKFIELSSFETQRDMEVEQFPEGAAWKKNRENRRLWEEEGKRRVVDRRKEKAKWLYEEQMKAVDEQEKLAEIRRYEEAIRREREEEERQKARNKTKKKKKSDIKDDYFDELHPRRNEWRITERDRSLRRRPALELGNCSAEYAPPTKRRRGGEVGLANILERILESLKNNLDVSYLFLKPVSKKEAPDYLDIIKRPMDLSTIREKVRKMEYKSQDAFRYDVWQIASNAHEYNEGRNPGIPPLADQLLNICDRLLRENRDELSEAEAGIDFSDT